MNYDFAIFFVLFGFLSYICSLHTEKGMRMKKRQETKTKLQRQQNYKKMKMSKLWIFHFESYANSVLELTVILCDEMGQEQ